MTRFNGERAPALPGVDSVQAQAYSHEVISAGFWPDGQRFLISRLPEDNSRPVNIATDWLAAAKK